MKYADFLKFHDNLQDWFIRHRDLQSDNSQKDRYNYALKLLEAWRADTETAIGFKDEASK